MNDFHHECKEQCVRQRTDGNDAHLLVDHPEAILEPDLIPAELDVRHWTAPDFEQNILPHVMTEHPQLQHQGRKEQILGPLDRSSLGNTHICQYLIQYKLRLSESNILGIFLVRHEIRRLIRTVYIVMILNMIMINIFSSSDLISRIVGDVTVYTVRGIRASIVAFVLAADAKQYALGLILERSLLLLLLGGKADLALILMEVNEVNLLDVDVQVAQPFVDVSSELGFDVFEGVGLIVYWTVDQGYLEFALVYLEIAVDDGEGAPAHGDVV